MPERSELLDRYEHELSVAQNVALETGTVAMRARRRGGTERIGYELKALIDKVANETLIESLSSQFPSDQIVTEETGYPASLRDRFWLADPWDGTTNQLNGIPHSAVLLSLVENGEVVMSVCFNPNKKDSMWAIKGAGAYTDRPAHVSEISDIRLASIVIDPGYRKDRKDLLIDTIAKLDEHVASHTILNGTGYTFYLMANGGPPGLVHYAAKPYEAASVLLFTEAGGKVTDFEGNEVNFDFTKPDSVQFVATNGLIHQQLLDLLR